MSQLTEPLARQPAAPARQDEPVRRASQGSGQAGAPDWSAMQAELDTWTRLRQGAG